MDLLSSGGQFTSMFREFNGENPFEFEADFSKTDLGDISVRLPGEVSGIRVTPSHKASEVEMTDGAVTWSNVTPRRPFPLSEPQVIILQDRAGDEVMTIPDSSRLEPGSRAALEKSARANSFILKVLEVRRVVVRGDELDWHVRIEGGHSMVVNTRGRRNVVVMDSKVILIDPHDNISEVNLKEVDKRSLRLISRTV